MYIYIYTWPNSQLLYHFPRTANSALWKVLQHLCASHALEWSWGSWQNIGTHVSNFTNTQIMRMFLRSEFVDALGLNPLHSIVGRSPISSSSSGHRTLIPKRPMLRNGVPHQCAQLRHLWGEGASRMHPPRGGAISHAHILWEANLVCASQNTCAWILLLTKNIFFCSHVFVCGRFFLRKRKRQMLKHG